MAVISKTKNTNIGIEFEYLLKLNLTAYPEAINFFKDPLFGVECTYSPIPAPGNCLVGPIVLEYSYESNSVRIIYSKPNSLLSIYLLDIIVANYEESILEIKIGSRVYENISWSGFSGRVAWKENIDFHRELLDIICNNNLICIKTDSNAYLDIQEILFYQIKSDYPRLHFYNMEKKRWFESANKK